MKEQSEKTLDEHIADGLTALTHKSHVAAHEAGWYRNPATGFPIDRNIGEMLMLIVSEVSEAMEGHRKDLPDDKLPHRRMLEVEMADAIIRIGDLAGYLGLDLGGAVLEKMGYNRTREDHRIENRASEGGKKF